MKFFDVENPGGICQSTESVTVAGVPVQRGRKCDVVDVGSGVGRALHLDA